MALIKTLRGITPTIGEGCYLAENCSIIGDVSIGKNCSIWFNTVLRGDVNYIKIGNNVNIQDGAVIHGTYNRAATDIGDSVSIAHNAVIHGATIKDKVLIGMGAVIMDNVIIESNTIIAAGTVILSNSHLESNSVYAGTPGKKIKTIEDGLIKEEIERIANNYTLYSSWYK